MVPNFNYFTTRVRVCSRFNRVMIYFHRKESSPMIGQLSRDENVQSRGEMWDYFSTSNNPGLVKVSALVLLIFWSFSLDLWTNLKNIYATRF